jgi:uncharacterized membrane protein
MDNSFFADDTEEQSTEPTEVNLETDDQSDQMTDEARLGAIMSYIPFLCFFPLLKMRDHPQTRFHARQGVMLFLIELVAALFLIDGISDLIFKVVLIVAAAASLAGIYFALKGHPYRLPVISDLADKFKL